MESENLTLAFDGEGVRDGTIDVHALAPALLSIGTLFDAANRTLYGDASKIDVRVRAVDHACFEIDLMLGLSVWQQVQDIFTSQTANALMNLRGFVVGFGVPAGVGLVWLVRKLRGRHPEKATDNGDGTVTLEIGKESFVVPMELLRLYRDYQVRHALDDFSRVVESNGVERVEFRPQRRGQPLEQITRAERPFFAAPEPEEEVLTEETFTKAFSIVSLAFKQDNKWRLHDGSNQIYVTISDEQFLHKVANDEIQFASGDVLVCDVIMRQRQADSGLKTEYEVTRVRDHKKRPRQLNIPIDNQKPDEK